MYAVSGRTTWADGVVIEGVGTSDGCSVAVSLMSAAMFSNTVFEASRLEKSSIPETAYTYEIPAPQNANQNSKKKSRIGSFLRRGTALLAAAALFGGVAAGAFIGFNELYYRLNPSAKPSL